MRPKKKEKTESEDSQKAKKCKPEEPRETEESLRKEKDELFAQLQRVSADYANYQAGVEREIPVVILSPAD